MTLTMKFSVISNLSLKEPITLISWSKTFYYNQSPSVTNDEKAVYNNDLTDKELFDTLKGIPNNKYPPNDGLIKKI